MPSFLAQCPGCSRSYSVDNQHSGKRVRCKQCGHPFSLTPSSADTDPPPSSPTTTLPELIGRFEIRARLGAGAFGTVYKAYDPVLDREVALKVPHPGSLQSPKLVERFLREAKASARLHHPHIIPVFDAGADGEIRYIASAFIPGRVLADAIEDEGPFDLRRAAGIIRDLAEALQYAHSLGIVHRDVKPANIMLDAEGRAHLMDFGLARFDLSEEKLTKDGAVMGTPAYMPPEQARGDTAAIGPHSDQYSLGATLYELLTGHTPFSGPSEIVLFNVLRQEPPAPRKERPEVPLDLETICLKALAKEPEARYRHCQDLAEDLRFWLDDEPIRARRLGTAERLARWCCRNPALATATSLAVLALITVAVVASFSAMMLRDRADRETLARTKAEAAQAAEADARTKAEAAQAAEADARVSETEAKQLEKAHRHRAEEALAKEESARYAQQITLADREWEDNHPERAESILEECKPELRRWEWAHLMRRCRSDTLTLSSPNSDHLPVHAMAFSPDGIHLGILIHKRSRDRISLHSFDTAGGRMSLSEVDFRGTSLVEGIAETDFGDAGFSPDGMRVASVGKENVVRVLNAIDGRELTSLAHEANLVNGEAPKRTLKNSSVTVLML